MIYRNLITEKLNAIQSVNKLMEEHKITGRIPGLLVPCNALQKRIGKIELLCSFSTMPLADAKKTERSQLAERAALLGNAIYAYAAITKNTVLKNAIQYSYSDIYRAKENTLVGRCRQIINAARKIKNGNEFGISMASIEETEKCFQKFLEIIDKPSERLKDRTRRYRHIDKLLDECFKLIDDEILPLVFIYDKEKVLTTSFKNARIISKTPGRRRKYVKKNIIKRSDETCPAAEHKSSDAYAVEKQDEINTVALS